MNKKLSYDSRCYDLAEIFLSDEPNIITERHKQELAAEIQSTIEEYIRDAREEIPEEQYYGDHHRFAIKKFRNSDNQLVYMVHDADWITNDEACQGHSSPTVAQFDTSQEAKEWCDKVLAGVFPSVPHESNFVGWPELEQRVHEFLVGRNT